MTTAYLVQHGDKERVPGDPGLTELGKRQAEATARWLRVTIDLLRNLLGDDRLPAHLMGEGIPPCAITTLDDLHVTGIAATDHLTGL